MGELEHRFPRYSRLIRLYPAAYRQRYQQEMLQTLADMLDDPDNSNAVVWLRTLIDLPFSALNQQLTYAGGTMTEQTPHYLKRNALISALLVAPFFVIIVANSLDNHTLADGQPLTDTLRFMITGLPAMAFLLGAATLVRWVSERHKQHQASVLRSLFDLRRDWAILATTALGLLIVAFVLGHDSVHCVIGNPIRELHNPNQTWQCIRRG